MAEPITDLDAVRLAKIDELRAAGIEPYPPRLDRARSHTAAEAVRTLELAENNDEALPTEVTVAGRMLSRRIMGKVGFAHLEDGSGKIQVFVRQDVIGQDVYDTLFKKLLDLGDFVAVSGRMVRTKTGEISVEAHHIQLLAKSLEAMPDKWHGVKDVELRYRRRYVDLMVNDEVRQTFITRSKMVQAIREYLDGNGFIEVETPVLQPIYGGAAARPFTTFHNQLKQDLYLRISFELYLKRLLVGGLERVYELGRDFRNEGVSFKHNPEFTQLEWYEAYTDYHGVMRRVEDMLAHVARRLTGGTTIVYQGHEIDLDSLLGNHVEPNLIQPTFVTDYPIEISPLAKKTADDPTTVERFEYFIAGLEMGNAFSELNDPIDQRARMEWMQDLYAAGEEDRHPVDEDYLLAMSYGMPPNGGFGTGVDRLAMLFTDSNSIRDVLLFPHLRSVE